MSAGERQRQLRIVVIALIGMLAGFLRYQAVLRLPVDKDERAYLSAAFRYQELMSQGRWKEIPAFRDNLEHPPLIKLLFAIDLRVRHPTEPDWDSLSVGQPVPSVDRSAFYGARLISALGGTLQVLVIAAVHPIAGVLLAFDTYHIKYCSEAYLEGVSGLMAVLAVFLFELGLGRKFRSLLLVSAVALALAAAGKYLYGLVGVVVVVVLLYRTGSLRAALVFCSIALFVFVLVDPFLWSNPYGRLLESLFSHWRIARGERIMSLAMPWYSPIIYLLHSEPAKWHPGVFHTRLADALIVPMSLVGIRRALHERPIWVASAGVGLIVLLIWPAKMHQYTLLIVPPLAVCAGIGIEHVGRMVWSTIETLLPYHRGGGNPA